MLVGWLVISTWSPPKSLAWQKGFRLGSGLTFEVSWALAGKQLASSCMREWGSSGGTRRDFMVGCPLSSSCYSSLFLIMSVGLVVLPSRFDFLLSGLLPGCPLLIKVENLGLWRFVGSGKFMMIVCSSCLGRMLFF